MLAKKKYFSKGAIDFLVLLGLALLLGSLPLAGKLVGERQGEKAKALPSCSSTNLNAMTCENNTLYRCQWSSYGYSWVSIQECTYGCANNSSCNSEPADTCSPAGGTCAYGYADCSAAGRLSGPSGKHCPGATPCCGDLKPKQYLCNTNTWACQEYPGGSFADFASCQAACHPPPTATPIPPTSAPTSPPVPPTAVPTTQPTFGPTLSPIPTSVCSLGQKRCLDSVALKECKYYGGVFYWDEIACAYGCDTSQNVCKPAPTSILPTNTPLPTATNTPSPLVYCGSFVGYQFFGNKCYHCQFLSQSNPPEVNNSFCSPTPTAILPTGTPLPTAVPTIYCGSFAGYQFYSGKCWRCLPGSVPMIVNEAFCSPTATPKPPTPTSSPIIPTVTVSPIGQPTTTPSTPGTSTLACYTKDLLICENGMVQKCNASGLKDANGLYEGGTYINVERCENGCKQDGSPNCEPLNCNEGEIRCLDPNFAGTCKVYYWERKYCQFGCYSGACNVAVTTSTTPYGGIQATQPAGGLTSTIYQQSGNIPIGTQADEEAFYRLTGGVLVGSFAAVTAPAWGPAILLAGATYGPAVTSAGLAGTKVATGLMATSFVGQLGVYGYESMTGQPVSSEFKQGLQTIGAAGMGLVGPSLGLVYGGQIWTNAGISAQQTAANRQGATENMGGYESVNFPGFGRIDASPLKGMSYEQMHHMTGVTRDEYDLIVSQPGTTFIPIDRAISSRFTLSSEAGWGNSGLLVGGLADPGSQTSLLNPDYVWTKTGAADFTELAFHEAGHLAPGYVSSIANPIPGYVGSSLGLSGVFEEVRAANYALQQIQKLASSQDPITLADLSQMTDINNWDIYRLWQRLMVDFPR